MTKFSAALVLASVCAATPVLAEEPVETEVPAALPATQETSDKSPFAEAEAIAEEKLAKIAGREDVSQLNNSDQANTVSENSVGDNSQTGTVRFEDNAFNNMTGLTIVNANTGNNVAINAAIQVNVALPSE
jgi:hypothetical protein